MSSSNNNDQDQDARHVPWLELVSAAVQASPCSTDPECVLDVVHHGSYVWISHQHDTHGRAARLMSGETLISRPRVTLVQQVARWLRLLHDDECELGASR